MKKYIYLTIGIVSMLIVSSCQKDVMDSSSSGDGGFSLILNVEDSETVATRAMTVQEAIECAKVKIYKPNFQGLIREYTYNAMPDVVYLPSGNGYRVDVIAGEAAMDEPQKATFEQKSYKGSAEFNIEANTITESVAVEAKICNAITNATFDQTITDNFQEGYTLTFTLPEVDGVQEKKLVYDASKNGADGYFIIDEPAIESKLFWTFTGTLLNDTPFSARGTITPSKDVNGNNVNNLIGAHLTMNFKYVVKDGTLVFDLKVNTDTENINDIIVWNPTSTGITPAEAHEIWATFATIKADVDTDTYDADKVYFEYREKVGSDETQNSWTRIQASTPAEDGAPYSAIIKGLTPNTEYEYQLVLWTKDTETTNDAGETVQVPGVEVVIGDDNNDKCADTPITLITGKVQQVPNASFEDAHTGSEGMDDGVTLFYPQGGTPWWGSGNQKVSIATAHVTKQSTVVPHSTNNNYSVILKSEVVSGVKFAAGNIYSGYFYSLDMSTQDGIVHFGRTTASDGSKFTSRPTGVSFYVRYQGNKVTDSTCTYLNKGDYDKGQIKFAIGTWKPKDSHNNKRYNGSEESPIAVNTADEGTFFKIGELDQTIAYCEKIFEGDGTDTGWLQVTLKFDYNSNGKGNTPKNPTHIIISAASSMYGDYFAGAEGSTMYIDDIKLLYAHPDDITEGVVPVQ